MKFRYAEIATSDMPKSVGGDEQTSRVVKVAFSSETPVLRTGDGVDHADGENYWEVLSHESGDADLALLQNRGAVLDEHDPKFPIGVIKSASIEADKKGRAELEMDEDGLGCERCRQMRSNMRPHISVGYDQTKLLATGKHTDGKPLKRFAWRAHEISSVAVPADAAAGVGRNKPAVEPETKNVDILSLTEKLTPEQKNRMRILLDPAAADGGTITAEKSAEAVKLARADAQKNERTRIKGIRSIADAFKRDFPHPDAIKKIDELTAAAESGEESAGEFSVRVLTTEASKFQRANIKVIADEELHDDISEYSFARAMRSAVEKNEVGASPDGLEGEVHKELQKRSKGDFTPQGFLMPFNRKLRADRRDLRKNRAVGDMTVGVFGQGGALVPTELMLPLIQLLRNKMVTERLGMRTISGLEGMITWPRHVAACTPYFVPETFLLNVSNPLLDQLAASPHRVGVTGAYSKQLILQSAIDVENWMRDDQLKTLAVLLDQVSMLGTGANNQPIGIFNTPGIGAVNFGGVVTYQKVVNFKTQLALANAAVADMAFVTTPLVEEKWRTTPKIGTTFPIFIWEDGSWGDETADGRVIGLRATATNQILNDRVGFGNFADAKKLIWGGLDIVVNPYTRSKEAVVEITTNSWMDVMVDHQQSFAYSVDAGDQ